jgi:hypothetical protein
MTRIGLKQENNQKEGGLTKLIIRIDQICEQRPTIEWSFLSGRIWLHKSGYSESDGSVAPTEKPAGEQEIKVQ